MSTHPGLASLPKRLVVVGGGGVGKTTLAAALAVHQANHGERTLVMTFDPSLRLKDALGIRDSHAVGGSTVRETETRVPLEADSAGELYAHLLDAERTFHRLIEAYSEDEATRDRILGNRFFQHLAGELAGILEYMAVERFYEAVEGGRYDRIILDTPPTREALDFLDAPRRIVSFLDSGAVRVALKPWFDEAGRLRPAEWLGLGRPLEALLDRVIGIGLLRDMAEFFRAFAPLFAGFRQRAEVVDDLLRSEETGFVLVAAPAERSVADTMFFARSLIERGHHLVSVVANRVHPTGSGRDPIEKPAAEGQAREGLELMAWLGERDRRGLESLRDLLADGPPVVSLPLLEAAPGTLPALDRFGRQLEKAWFRGL